MAVLHLVEEGFGVSASSKFGCYGLLAELFDVDATSMLLNLVSQILLTSGADVADLELAEAHSRIKIKTLISTVLANDVCWAFHGFVYVAQSRLLEVQIVLEVILIKIALCDGFWIHF